MAQLAIECDVVVVGGGVAGLWALARLRSAGYGAVLVSRGALGAGQTLASQGIIHGGLKYSFGMEGADSSAAIAQMPGRWRACLEGRGEVDLRGVEVLSEVQHFWTSGGLASRLAAAAASKVIRTGVRKVGRGDGPEWMAGAGRGVACYAVDEPVLEPRSLVRQLARGSEGAVVCVGGDERVWAERRDGGGGGGVVVRSEGGGVGGVEVRGAAVVCAAGGGNEALGEGLGASEWGGQRRPLHMVMVRGEGLASVYGHCVGASSVPRVTVTSQRMGDDVVWWVGGQVAEEGVGRGEAEQIEVARGELVACLPWLAGMIEGAPMATWRGDRVEGRTAGGGRPSGPMVREIGGGRGVVVWPTKLALAPVAADLVLSWVERAGIGKEHEGVGAGMEEGGKEMWNVGQLEWEKEGVGWR